MPEPDLPSIEYYDGVANGTAKFLTPQEAMIGGLVGLSAGALIGFGFFLAVGATTVGPTVSVGGVTYIGTLTAEQAAQVTLLEAYAIETGLTGGLRTALLHLVETWGLRTFSFDSLCLLAQYDIPSSNAWDGGRMNAYLSNYFGGGGPGPSGTWPGGYPLYPGGGGPSPSPNPNPITNPGPGGVGGPPDTSPPPPAGSPPPPPPPGVGGDAEASACFVPGDIEFCHKLD